ncbi:MAG: hypothetical protein AB7E55_33930 [Pigmentiphaga sp.]
MSCNHLCDCLWCGGIVDDLEEQALSAESTIKRLTDDLEAEHRALKRAIARVAELEAMLPGQHTVGATICAEETMPESLQSALAEAERGSTGGRGTNCR